MTPEPENLTGAAHYLMEVHGWRREDATRAVVNLYFALHHPTNEGRDAARDFGIMLPRPDGESLRDSLRLLWAPGTGLSGKDSTLRKVTGGVAALNACVCLKRWALEGTVFLHNPRQCGKRWADLRFFADEAHHIFEGMHPRTEEELMAEMAETKLAAGEDDIEATLGGAGDYGFLRAWNSANAHPTEELTEATLPWTWRGGEWEVTTGPFSGTEYVGGGCKFTTLTKKAGKEWPVWPCHWESLETAVRMHRDRIAECCARMARRDYLEHGTAYTDHRGMQREVWAAKVAELERDLADERAAWRETHAPAIEFLQTQCKSLNSENATLCDENERLNTENASLHANNENLRTHNLALIEERARVEKENRGHVRAYDFFAHAASDNLARVQKEHRLAAADRDRLQATAIELEQELAVARSTVDTLRAELTTARNAWHKWQSTAVSHAAELRRRTEDAANLRRVAANVGAFTLCFTGTLAAGVAYYHTLAQWVAAVWQHAPSSEAWACLAVALALLLPLLRRAPVVAPSREGLGIHADGNSERRLGVDFAAPGTKSKTVLTAKGRRKLQEAMGVAPEALAVVENPNRSTAVAADQQPSDSKRRPPCHLCGVEDSPLHPGYCDDCGADCAFCGDPAAPSHTPHLKPCCTACVPF